MKSAAGTSLDDVAIELNHAGAGVVHVVKGCAGAAVLVVPVTRSADDGGLDQYQSSTSYYWRCWLKSNRIKRFVVNNRLCLWNKLHSI